MGSEPYPPGHVAPDENRAFTDELMAWLTTPEGSGPPPQGTAHAVPADPYGAQPVDAYPPVPAPPQMPPMPPMPAQMPGQMPGHMAQAPLQMPAQPGYPAAPAGYPGQAPAMDPMRSAVDPSRAMAAAELLMEIHQLRTRNAAARQHRERELWYRLSNARTELARRQESPTAGKLTAALTRSVTKAHEDRLEAEEKAQRALSGPNAYRKFVEARRWEERLLAEAGFKSWEDFAVVMAGINVNSYEVSLADLQQAAAEAESAWAAFEREGNDPFGGSPEAEVLRARGYRIIGAVVDDNRLIMELEFLAQRRGGY
jgi:hypothetical protein